ncbi:MAG: hypothetical protein NT098_05035 [Candidatus Parcubacteria bacterium]|nr:hypothetical protein [Candidatus Parcubacteria bacterium]
MISFCKNWKRGNYHPSRILVGFQIFLLVLIIVGIALIFTQDKWVPKLVEFILLPK